MTLGCFVQHYYILHCVCLLFSFQTNIIDRNRAQKCDIHRTPETHRKGDCHQLTVKTRSRGTKVLEGSWNHMYSTPMTGRWSQEPHIGTVKLLGELPQLSLPQLLRVFWLLLFVFVFVLMAYHTGLMVSCV